MFSDSDAGFEGAHYSPKRLLNSPPPLSRPRPRILIGGGGEKKTLRFVARYADACNLFDGGDEMVAHKLDVIREHCEAEGRDYDEIEKTVIVRIAPDATAKSIAGRLERLRALGITHAIGGPPIAADEHYLDLLGEIASLVADL
jgi:alkanesulfonate monooxygenase